MTYTAVLATVNFLILVAIFVRQEMVNRKKIAATDELLAHNKKQAVREEQIWDVLQVVKDREENARIHHREADLAKETIGRKVDEKTDQLVHKIEEVPQKVVDVIKGGESGSLKKPPPPL